MYPWNQRADCQCDVLVLAVSFAFATNRVWAISGTPTRYDHRIFRADAFVFWRGCVVTLVIEGDHLLVFITWLGFNSMVVKVIAQVIVMS